MNLLMCIHEILQISPGLIFFKAHLGLIQVKGAYYGRFFLLEFLNLNLNLKGPTFTLKFWILNTSSIF